MATEYQYTALMCSLPAYESLFSSKQTPISRIQLDKRLCLLEPEDAHDIDVLGNLLDWFRHPLDRSDEAFLLMASRSIEIISSPFIRDMIVWRLELRTIVAALRRKHSGIRFVDGVPWGHGRWVKFIESHYQEPFLGLERFFPWVVDATKFLESEDSMALERCLLSEVWRWLDQVSCGHEFDLEAVAIYRTRWDLVARWTSYDETIASERFLELLDSVLPD